jgi:hypothetical protein
MFNQLSYKGPSMEISLQALSFFNVCNVVSGWSSLLFLIIQYIIILDLERRDLSHKEKLYLREQNVITETQCTLGEK